MRFGPTNLCHLCHAVHTATMGDQISLRDEQVHHLQRSNNQAIQFVQVFLTSSSSSLTLSSTPFYQSRVIFRVPRRHRS